MDSSPGELESDQDLLVRNVLSFLDPETVRAWRSLSHDYDISVSRLQRDQLIAKRRIEEYLGIKLDPSYPGEEKQDWEFTYEIVTSNEKLWPTLWYTGSEVDKDVARKLGVQPYTDMMEMKYAVYNAAKVNTRIFRILFQSAGESFDWDNLETLVNTAISYNKQEVLDNPQMLDFISRASGPVILSILPYLAGDMGASPRVLDFFLTNAQTNGIDLSNTNTHALFNFVRYNQLAIIKVLHKHGMMDPFKIIENGKEYIALDDDYSYDWSPFWFACKSGYLPMIKYFLEHLPEDEDGERDAQNYDLDAPILGGHVEIVRLLLATGKVNLDYGNYLSTATISGSAEVVEMLFASGLKDRSAGDTTLFVYCLKIATTQDYADIAFSILKRIPRLSEAEKKDLLSLAKYNMNTELEKALRLHS